jgi:hypothetical protein
MNSTLSNYSFLAQVHLYAENVVAQANSRDAIETVSSSNH